MNLLIVGTRDKTEIILDHLPNTFLLIDDGPIIDSLELPTRRKVVDFDVSTHSFNPLKGIDYLRARQFVEVMNSVFPEGENTLTKRNSNFALLTSLLSNPTTFDSLIDEPDKKDTGKLDAFQKIQTILLSPVLERVLNHPTNFSLRGVVLLRLNRAELGDFDCFVLANLLIASYKGQVVIPDFGFYACPFHTSLIRQNRLIAGVNFLDEAPKLRNPLLLIDEKFGQHTTEQDARTLSGYVGLKPNSNAQVEFIERMVE